MTNQTSVPAKEHSADFDNWVYETFGDMPEVCPIDLLEEAEKKAPKFSLHHLDHNRYIAVIDPFYARTWSFEFTEKQVISIQGLNSRELINDTVLYLRSDFSKEMIIDAIKLSFV